MFLFIIQNLLCDLWTPTYLAVKLNERIGLGIFVPNGLGLGCKDASVMRLCHRLVFPFNKVFGHQVELLPGCLNGSWRAPNKGSVGRALEQLLCLRWIRPVT